MVLLAAALLALVVAAGIVFWSSSQPDSSGASRPLRELPLADLVTRDGRLYAPAESTPFHGRLYQNFPSSEEFPTTPVRKLEIDIHDGKAHGRSVGYFDDGKLEVEEFFTNGVSNGLRTRWDQAGWKKSEEMIEHGQLNGRHMEWHPNGSKAVEMTMKNGQPEGLVEAWYPDGKLKSRTRFSDGKITKREFFPMAGQDPSPQEEPSETPGCTDESGQSQN
jgi:antitoxin component YwqK of YwqJK toxin-antitoxin module